MSLSQDENRKQIGFTHCLFCVASSTRVRVNGGSRVHDSGPAPYEFGLAPQLSSSIYLSYELYFFY
jgi:hypothetical protein